MSLKKKEKKRKIVPEKLLRTSHNKGSHDVITAGHGSFDEGCETSTILYFGVYTGIVV